MGCTRRSLNSLFGNVDSREALHQREHQGPAEGIRMASTQYAEISGNQKRALTHCEKRGHDGARTSGDGENNAGSLPNRRSHRVPTMLVQAFVRESRSAPPTGRPPRHGRTHPEDQNRTPALSLSPRTLLTVLAILMATYVSFQLAIFGTLLLVRRTAPGRARRRLVRRDIPDPR